MEVTGSTGTLAVNFCKTAKTSIDQFLWPKFLTICEGGAVAGFDARAIFSFLFGPLLQIFQIGFQFQLLHLPISN